MTTVFPHSLATLARYKTYKALYNKHSECRYASDFILQEAAKGRTSCIVPSTNTSLMKVFLTCGGFTCSEVATDCYLKVSWGDI